MSDLKRIYLITRHFDELQGLKTVSVGFLLILFWVDGIGQAKTENLSLPLIQFILFIAVYTAIDLGYKRKYGVVKRRKTWVEIAFVVAASALIMLADWADVKLTLPISLTGLSIAGISLLIWQLSERFRHHYIVLAIIATVASLFPLIFGNTIQWHLTQGDGLLLLGFFGIFGGMIDHMILVRAFPLIKEETK